MKLSKRIDTIISLVPEKGNIFDIGCDHGIVSVFFALQKRCVTAIDIHEKPLKKAVDLAQQYQVYHNMTFLVNDGIKGIFHNDNDILILTGMGGSTILEILKEEKDGIFIIEAHTDIPYVRQELSKKGFYITDEKAIYDKKWYVLMKWEKGKANYDEIDYFLGPFCKYNKEYVTYIKDKYEKIYQKSNNELQKKIVNMLKKHYDECFIEKK